MLRRIFSILACAVACVAGCGGGDDGGGGRGGNAGKDGGGGTGGGEAGDAGGLGGGGTNDGGDAGPKLAPICVKSPSVMPFAGDATCPAPKPSANDALDEALAKAGIDRCSYGFSDSTMSIWKTIFADDKY